MNGRPLLLASSGARDTAGVIADAASVPPQVDLIEVRLDRFDDLAHVDSDALSDLVRRLERPAICTLRTRAEGGEFDGSIEERVALLTRAQDAGFAWLDVEQDIADRVPRGASKRIVSWHGVEATDDGATPVRALAALPALQPADVLKVAAPADDAEQALRFVNSAVDAGRAAGHRVTAIAMGNAGRYLRPLAGRFGMPLLFSAAHASRKTANGQLTAQELVEVYRAHTVTPETRVFAVVGADVSTSLSPRVHNRVFRTLEMDCVYVDLSTPAFHQAAEVADMLPLEGLSVTAPFKTDALSYAFDADNDARIIGAVNTLVRDQQGRLCATNTDAPGFMAGVDLAVERPDVVRELCVGNSFEALRLVDGTRASSTHPLHNVLVYGSGGVARAIAHALRDRGSKVCVTGRSFERVTSLVLSLSVPGKKNIESISPERAVSLSFDLRVKTTPLADTDFPVDFPEARRAGIAADVNYQPLDTPFLREARKWGHVPVPGLLMFSEQAVLQAARFTGHDPAELRPIIADALTTV